MTLILEMPTDLEKELIQEADRLGLSVHDYILNLLHYHFGFGATPKSGTELVVYWQHAGLVGTHLEIEYSQYFARKLRQEAEKISSP
jgi:hypothetical protein